MISDERQRRLFALWISLPTEAFATWMDQQADKEALRRLIAHMESTRHKQEQGCLNVIKNTLNV